MSAPISDWPLVGLHALLVSGGRSVPSAGREFLDLLPTTVMLDACRSMLAEVLTLAQRSPELSDEQLRAALVAVGERAARLLEGENR